MVSIYGLFNELCFNCLIIELSDIEGVVEKRSVRFLIDFLLIDLKLFDVICYS